MKKNIGGIMYCLNLETKTAEIIKNEKIFENTYEGTINIPSQITYGSVNYYVTSIGEEAFYDCNHINSVIIPNSIVNIGANAFCGCTRLTSVNIPSTVQSIGYGAFNDTGIYNNPANWDNDALYLSKCLIDVKIPLTFEIKVAYTIKESTRLIANSAFSRCIFLRSITIPNSVAHIGDWALDCKNLISIIIESNNPYYSSENGVLFDKSKTTLIKCPASKQGEYIIPSSVTRIGDYAFSGCSKLSSISLPNSLTNIGEQAFSDCYSITSITIPHGVTNIKDNTFRECISLANITLPNSITNIGFGAFCNCKNLINITIPNSVKSIGQAAFSGTGVYNNESNWENKVLYISGCLVSVKTFSIDSTFAIKVGTRLIANGVFWNCNKLTSITIPNGVISIGTNAFLECSNLTSVTIPNSVITIGSCAFSNCYKLTSVTIPHSVKDIGIGAFQYCSDLSVALISNGVVSIGDKAFKGCDSLTSITIPSSVQSIGVCAFDCRSLISIEVDVNNPNYCSVENVLFDKDKTTLIKCSVGKKGTYVIDNNIKSIQESAFSNCKDLSCINIPDSVNSIGEYAFFSCASLSSISIHNKITSIGNKIFLSCTSLKNIYISKGKIEEYCKLGLGEYRNFIQESQEKSPLQDIQPQRQQLPTTKYLFFDTECNGLPQYYNVDVCITSNWPRMIQLAWLVTDEQGNILKRQSRIICPQGFTISTEVANLTGITTSRAQSEGVNLRTVLNEFMNDLVDAQLVIGHNVDFDLHILGCELYREGMDYDALLNKPSICTMQCSTNYCAIPNNSKFGGYKWPKLEELHHKLFGYTFSGAHDALADVEATRSCYFELKEKGIL